MPTFETLLKEKNKRLESIPLALQTTLEKQQRKTIAKILKELNTLETSGGNIVINSKNLKKISEISDELKTIFLNDEYLKAVKEFSKEFKKQSTLNQKLIDSGFGETENPIAAKTYIEAAQKNAVKALTEDNLFVKPISEILESSVVNGASVADTIASITTFVEGNEDVDSKVLKYVKQITNDSFAIADRSYTSIVSDALENDWFYYAGSEVENTRCFCLERVGRYFHYKEIEAWGRGENLGDCNIGGGRWAGEIPATNESTIYSYLGGYNCMHSLMIVSEFIVPESDIERARSLGYID